MYPAEAARFGEILRLLRNTSDVFRTGGVFMAISYSKLWNLVRQNKMNKGELTGAVGISDYMMAKLNKDETAQMEIMNRLYKAFYCDIDDLMEAI